MTAAGRATRWNQIAGAAELLVHAAREAADELEDEAAQAKGKPARLSYVVKHEPLAQDLALEIWRLLP